MRKRRMATLRQYMAVLLRAFYPNCVTPNLIGKFASGAGKKAGEFYTPPEVSELLAKLVDPQPGERLWCNFRFRF